MPKDAWLENSQRAVWGEFLLVVCAGGFRQICKVAHLKSLLIRSPVWVNVKGQLFHQESPELSDWQRAGCPWRGFGAASLPCIVKLSLIPRAATQVGMDKIMLASDSHRELQHLLHPLCGLQYWKD